MSFGCGVYWVSFVQTILAHSLVVDDLEMASTSGPGGRPPFPQTAVLVQVLQHGEVTTLCRGCTPLGARLGSDRAGPLDSCERRGALAKDSLFYFIYCVTPLKKNYLSSDHVKM